MRAGTATSRMLTCEECRREASPESRGWVAYRVEDPDEPEKTFVVVYCPACAVREFGGQPAR
jgi:hypothetical protein